MKRIATLAVILLLGFAAQATSVRYFTLAQAQRTVRYLDAQNEMMIYCGYDYEIETYVLINEVWMERVNSAYYEIWVYGYDAYTGDEIYMPLDLGCVWLYSAGRMYNAAQYLRFHTSARPPQFTWHIPTYNRFTRVIHRPGFTVSYHYEIHRHGWMPPTHHHHGPGMPPPLPPYYMRTPGTPAPHPQAAWTPGVDRPQVVQSNSNIHTETGRVTTGGGRTQQGSSTGTSSGTRTGSSSGARTGNSQGTGTATPSSGNPRQTTGTTPTRGNATGNTSGTTTQGGSSNPRTGGTTTTQGGSSNNPRTGGTTTTQSGSSNNPRTGGTTTTQSGSSSNPRTGGTTTTQGGSSNNPRTGGTTTQGGSSNPRSGGTTTQGSSSNPRSGGTTTQGSSSSNPRTGSSSNPRTR